MSSGYGYGSCQCDCCNGACPVCCFDYTPPGTPPRNYPASGPTRPDPPTVAREAVEEALERDLQRIDSGANWRKWLADNELSKFERQFDLDLGITHVSDFEFVTAEDLRAIGVSNPKIRRFEHAVGKMKD